MATASRLRQWMRRHRTKLVLGVMAGGAAAVAGYHLWYEYEEERRELYQAAVGWLFGDEEDAPAAASGEGGEQQQRQAAAASRRRQRERAHEEEALRAAQEEAAANAQQHLESVMGVCEKRVWPYGLPRIRAALDRMENVESLTAALKATPALSREEKVALWKGLQTCSFARALGAIFGLAAYTCYCGVQHALIGRYLFVASSLEPSAAAAAARLPKLAMERFLCASEHFLGAPEVDAGHDAGADADAGAGSGSGGGSGGGADDLGAAERRCQRGQASGLRKLVEVVHAAVAGTFDDVGLADAMPPMAFIEHLTRACVTACEELRQYGYANILQDPELVLELRREFEEGMPNVQRQQWSNEEVVRALQALLAESSELLASDSFQMTIESSIQGMLGFLGANIEDLWRKSSPSDDTPLVMAKLVPLVTRAHRKLMEGEAVVFRQSLTRCAAMHELSTYVYSNVT